MNKTDLSRRETRCSLPSFAFFAADQRPWSSNLRHLVPQSSSQQKVLHQLHCKRWCQWTRSTRPGADNTPLIYFNSSIVNNCNVAYHPFYRLFWDDSSSPEVVNNSGSTTSLVWQRVLTYPALSQSSTTSSNSFVGAVWSRTRFVHSGNYNIRRLSNGNVMCCAGILLSGDVFI